MAFNSKANRDDTQRRNQIMNPLIERYIYSVTRRSPEHKRDDIKKELESNILDMLEAYPNYNDEDIEAVLHKIGHPMNVALQYQDKSSYVVDPRFYEDYKLFLKLALIFSTMLAVVVGIITSLSQLDMNNPTSLFGILFSEITSNVFIFGFNAFGLVTLGFWAYQIPKIKKKVDEKLDNWKVSDLSQVPTIEPNESLKSRTSLLVGMIFAIVFSISFGALFIAYYETFIALSLNGVTTQVLNSAYKGVFTLFIMTTIIFMIINYLYTFYRGKETLQTLIISTISEFYSVIFMTVILLLPNLVLPENFVSIANFMETDLVNVTTVAVMIQYLMIIIMLLTSFITYFRRWLKYIKNNKR